MWNVKGLSVCVCVCVCCLAIIWLDLPADWPEPKSKSVTDSKRRPQLPLPLPSPHSIWLRLRLHFCQVAEAAEKRMQKKNERQQQHLCLSAKLQLHADWPQLYPPPLPLLLPLLLLLLFLLFVVSVASFHSSVLCLFLAALLVQLSEWQLPPCLTGSALPPCPHTTSLTLLLTSATCCPRWAAMNPPSARPMRNQLQRNLILSLHGS